MSKQDQFAPLHGFATRVRKSPYFEATRRHGAKAYSVYNHMHLPLFYESPEADFEHLIAHVSLWDVGVQRQVEIKGPDAQAFTQLLTPRNLSACAVGQCKYVLLTNEAGGIINDPVLLRLDENRYWLSLSDSDILFWAQGVKVNSGLDVEISEPDVSPLQIQGPKSADVVAALFGPGILDLKYYWHRTVQLDGMDLVISRTGWSSERGYELYLQDATRGDDLWDAIIDAGRPFNIKPGAPSSIRRIEGGITSYGADFGPDDTPFHANLARLADLDMEAGFIGKDALRAAAGRPLERKLVALEMAGDPLPAVNAEYWPAFAGGQRIGEVRSAVWSPRLRKNIGFAMLAIAHTEEGAGFEAETAHGRRDAVVVEMPFTPSQTTQ